MSSEEKFEKWWNEDLAKFWPQKKVKDLALKVWTEAYKSGMATGYDSGVSTGQELGYIANIESRED